MSTPEASNFDPYHKWLGIPLAEQPPNHYRLLGLTEFEDDPDVIAAAADRQMGHVKGFATGRYGAHSQQLLNELAKVRVCLLNPKLKPAYDEELRRKLTPKPAPATQVARSPAPVTSVAAPPSVIRGPKIEVVREPQDPAEGLPSLKPPRRALLARRRRKQNSALPLFLGIVIAALAIAGVLIYYATQPVP
ncbi:hypothetical protein [Aeoliella sp. SH292]|uniref:hypothetical protein n=1 Tax=Aeoliella sp. SH292 TaxID=3454464 RepID=UPI003F95A680